MGTTGERRGSARGHMGPRRVLSMVAVCMIVASLTGCADRGPASGDATRSGRTGRVDTSTTASPSTASPSTAPTPSSAVTPTTSTIAPVPSSSGPDSSAPTGRSGRFLVVVDPGHNGQNFRHTAEINRMVDAGGFRKECNTTGTAGQGLTEAAFTWQLAGSLRDELGRRGADVVLTRQDNDGWGPCIDARGQVAATHHAAALVSIHADGAAAGEHGFHVIHPAPGKAVSASNAAASAAFAAVVRDELVAAGFKPSTYVGRNGLIQRSDLGTLNRAEVPAVMIECGNMRNAGDLAAMSSPQSRQLMAKAIASATSRWLGGSG